MRRDLPGLARGSFDLGIIGGGIYGACVAWEAATRGLTVALLEKSDFASATSANSLKIIHGGFRYLQHADFRRVRESFIERQILMRVAPHLIRALPVLVPTYGHGLKGREAMSVALAIYEALTFDRHFGLTGNARRRTEDPLNRIPPGRMLSRGECLEILPGLERRGLTGGAIFYDAQVHNSERLVLAFLRSAAEAGAALANYAEVTGFLQDGSGVRGVRVADRLSGEELEVRARLVVNTSGPWLAQVLSRLPGAKLPAMPLAKAANLVTRRLFATYAVGLVGRNGYGDEKGLRGGFPHPALIREGSLLFVAPWGDHSLIGTSYHPYNASPDGCRVIEPDIQELLEAINRAYPDAGLTRQDVTFAHAGLMPLRGTGGTRGPVRLAHQFRLWDHSQEGLPGLLSMMGVKYTTARTAAEKTLDRIFAIWGRAPSPSVTPFQPLHGGQIERLEVFVQDETARQPCALEAAEVRDLIDQYGSAFPEVLRYYVRGTGSAAHTSLLRTRTLHAIREEMALRLSDVIFRRTELGTAGHPGKEILRFVAEVMAEECGWSEDKRKQEIDEVDRSYPIA